MSANYLLGIDIGTLGSKGVALTPDGHVVAQFFCEHPVIHPQAGWAEHDAERQWWGDVVTVSQALLHQSGIDPREIAGVCVSGLIPDLLPTDEHGVPLRNAILYSDNRAVDEINQINALTGAHLTSEEITPKLLWYMRHEPELFRRTHMVFNAHSYVVYKLTGVYSVDYITAAYFGAIFSATQECWLGDTCEKIGFDAELLPRTYPVAGIVGEVTRHAADETGLAEGTPVLAGCGDVFFSLLGAGVIHKNEIELYYGTAGLATILNCDLVETAMRPCCLPSQIPWDYPAYMPTSGEAIRWFRDQFGQAEMKVEQETGVSAYSLLDARAAQVPPGCDGLLLLNYFLGQRSPVFDPFARAVYVGLTMAHTRDHMYRAVLESWGFGILHGLDQVVPGWRERARRVVATGGGARSTLYRQVVSDIVGVRQEHVARADAPLGDAYLVGYSMGIFKDFETIRDQWLQVTGVTEPKLENAELYRRLYEIYVDLHASLKDKWGPLSAAAGSSGM